MCLQGGRLGCGARGRYYTALSTLPYGPHTHTHTHPPRSQIFLKPLVFPPHTVSHVTLLVSSGKFMGGSAFFLSPPENKKAKFAFCTLKRKGGSTQKQPFLTVRFRGALLTKSVTLEFSQGTVCCDLLYLSIYADTCIYK